MKISPASASSGSVALRSDELSTTVAPSATVRLLLISVGASFRLVKVIAAAPLSLSRPSLTETL